MHTQLPVSVAHLRYIFHWTPPFTIHRCIHGYKSHTHIHGTWTNGNCSEKIAIKPGRYQLFVRVCVFDHLMCVCVCVQAWDAVNFTRKSVYELIAHVCTAHTHTWPHASTRGGTHRQHNMHNDVLGAYLTIVCIRLKFFQLAMHATCKGTQCSTYSTG